MDKPQVFKKKKNLSKLWVLLRTTMASLDETAKKSQDRQVVAKTQGGVEWHGVDNKRTQSQENRLQRGHR